MKDSFKRYLLAVVGVFTVMLPFFFYSSSLKARQDLAFADKVLLTVTEPIAALFSFLRIEVKNSFEQYISLVDAKSEAFALRQQNAELSVKLQLARELELENQRLREIVNFTARVKEDFLAANVLSRDPSYFFDSIRINRGSDSGVKTGMAVVAADGAVGIVLNVFPKVARVLLVTDPNATIDVIVSRNRKRGVLQGTASNLMTLKHSGKGSRIQVGDQVLTSGLTSSFPRGIVVGRVVNVQLESDNVSQRVEVEPAVDFSDLSEVLVLNRPNPELDAIAQIGGQQWLDRVLHPGGGSAVQ